MKLLARLCVLLLVVMAACSPVKQVLKNPVYFKEVADGVVKRGYCINDTVFIHDTLVEEYVVDNPTFIHDTVYSTGLKSVLHFDTVFSNGTKVKIHKGTIAVDCPQVKGERVYIKTESVVRDRKLEKILDAEITSYKHFSDSLKQVVKERDLQIQQIEHRLTVSEWRFWLLIGLVLGIITYRTLRLFRII